MEQFTQAVIEFVRANQAWAAPVAFALAFGESLAFLSLLIPGSVILAAIGVLLGASGVDFVMVWLAAGIGGTLGYALSYWIGIYFKDDIDRMWPFRTRPHMLRRSRDFFDKWGIWAVFLGHFVGPVRAVIPVIAGSLAMRHIPFQIANTTSSFIWSGWMVFASAFGGSWLSGWIGG